MVCAPAMAWLGEELPEGQQDAARLVVSMNTMSSVVKTSRRQANNSSSRTSFGGLPLLKLIEHAGNFPKPRLRGGFD